MPVCWQTSERKEVKGTIEKNDEIMKRVLFMLFAFAVVLCLHAQGFGGQRGFSPDKFDADLREFITKEAKLTEQEAIKFFPVYKEMQTKQREVYGRQKTLGMSKPEDEKAYKDAIRQRDENDLEMKRIQQTYHEKFLKLLPASKVYAILHAEDMFYRRMLKRGTPNRNPMGFPVQYHNWKRRE